MYKLAIASFAFLFVIVSGVSQASSRQPLQVRCNLTEATSPSVRGLRLGMSAQQLLALFPGSTKRREIKDAVEKATAGTGTEATYLGFDPATDGNGRQFEGVESILAGVYKGRVVDFSIQYGDATWSTIDEWIAKLSEALKLQSAQYWVVGPSENPNKILKCDGILIEGAIQGGGSSIRISNLAYLKEIEERTKAAEEKKRRESKP